MKVALARMELRAPVRPIVANVDGAFYPTGPGADEQMLDILGRQVAEPVQFVRGLETLYDAGARMFVEVGPKRALHGFAEDVLGATHDDAQALFANHPKAGDVPSFNQALAGLYAAGLGAAGPRRAGPAPIAAPAPAPAAAPADHLDRLDPCPFWSRHDHRPLRRARPPVRRLPRARSRDHGGHRSRAAPAARARARWSRWPSPARPWGCPAPSGCSTTTTWRGCSAASS